MNESKTIISVNNVPQILKAVNGRSLIKAARAGGHVIESYARINIATGRSGLHTRSSNLEGSIIVEDADISNELAGVNIGPTTIYGRIQELGGIVKPVMKEVLSWVEDGVRVFRKFVILLPHPYLRPAADEHSAEAFEAVGAAIDAELNKAARK